MTKTGQALSTSNRVCLFQSIFGLFSEAVGQPLRRLTVGRQRFLLRRLLLFTGLSVQFHPGGAGINLTKQYANSGLADTVKMITPIYSMDERMLAATGTAGKGFYLSSLWSADLDNPQNRHFVEAFTKAYNRAPTAYAAQAYDTANLIASGLKAVDGDITGKADAFRDALRRADFPSVRGKFKFGPNQHPVQDWYLLHIEAGADGKLVYRNLKVIARDHTDVHAADCKM